MARNFNGTTNRINGVFPSVALPLTLAAWARRTVAGASHSLIGLNVASGSPNSRYDISIQATNVPRALHQNNATVGIAQGGSVGASTWSHICGVFTSTTSRSIFTNGGSKTTNTTSVPTFTNDTAVIGAVIGSGSYAEFFNGDIAEGAIWNIALTDDEVLSLARGFSPLLIHPQNLIFYTSLARDVLDIKGTALTTTGTTVSDHTRIIY